MQIYFKSVLGRGWVFGRRGAVVLGAWADVVSGSGGGDEYGGEWLRASRERGGAGVRSGVCREGSNTRDIAWLGRWSLTGNLCWQV